MHKGLRYPHISEAAQNRVSHRRDLGHPGRCSCQGTKSTKCFRVVLFVSLLGNISTSRASTLRHACLAKSLVGFLGVFVIGVCCKDLWKKLSYVCTEIAIVPLAVLLIGDQPYCVVTLRKHATLQPLSLAHCRKAAATRRHP